MTRYRAFLSAATTAAALFALAPSAATAQGGISDVIMAGRAHGAELSPDALRRMQALGPDAFEFQHVWKNRVERVRANREMFAASRMPYGMSRLSAAELQRAGAALDGTFRMPIILGRPSNATEPHTAAAYQERMFGDGAVQYSLTSLYDEMSQGVFEFTGDVVGWAALPATSSQYYGSDPDDTFGETPLFLNHALAAVDASVDFGLYDNDGPDGIPNSGDDDGFVDLAAFMYPAAGRECNNANGIGIWAHRFTIGGWGGGNYTTDDPSASGGNIQVADYIIQGGIHCDGTSLQEIGVVAHEAGHGFGLPDLYDTDACQGGATRCDDGSVGSGVGEWDLMGSGNWNVPSSPAHMSAHSKDFLGWIDVVRVPGDTTLTIEPIFESGIAYRIDLPEAPGEYFLLENRQALGSDAFINETGLLIWHVDSVQYETRRNGNGVNNIAAHKGLDLEEADGQNNLDAPNGSNRGDAGDPWPGLANRTTFDLNSTPNSNSYASGVTGIAIADIDETAGGDITLSITFPELVTYGDADGDASITAADRDLVMSYIVGVTGPDYTRIMAADVDDDGDVDARDAYIIDAHLNGVPTPGFRIGTLGVL